MYLKYRNGIGRKYAIAHTNVDILGFTFDDFPA